MERISQSDEYSGTINASNIKIKVNLDEPMVCGLFFHNAESEFRLITENAVGVYRVVFINQKVIFVKMFP